MVKKQVLATGVVLFSLLLPLEATAAEFNRIYIFSDSLSDQGNVFNVTRSANQLEPSLPIIPASPPYFNGRYSNGPIWAEYLADSLGIVLTPSTNLAVGAPITITPNGEFGVNYFFNGATTTQSVNFAFGGATTGLGNAGNPRLPGILREIQAYTDDLKLADQSGDPNALYIVWGAGSNDVAAGVLDPNIPAQNVSQGLTALYAGGARNFLVVNAPDLGKTPRALDLDPRAADSLSQFSTGYNSNLTTYLNGLSQTLEGVNIFSYDVDSLFQQAFADPAAFGLINVTEPCLTANSICSNPDEYLFWDEIHPTTAAHALTAKFAALELQAEPIPEPSSGVGVLVLGGLSAVAVLKRKGKRAH